jgi:hypothetical protein
VFINISNKSSSNTKSKFKENTDTKVVCDICSKNHSTEDCKFYNTKYTIEQSKHFYENIYLKQGKDQSKKLKSKEKPKSDSDSKSESSESELEEEPNLHSKWNPC